MLAGITLKKKPHVGAETGMGTVPMMARERARIGLAASKGDWPRRIAEYARDDQEDAAAYAANY